MEEANSKLFVDLCKAYNSCTQRSSLACLAEVYVPDVMVELLQSLHDEMSVVTVEGERSEPKMVCIKDVPSPLLCLPYTLNW